MTNQAWNAARPATTPFRLDEDAGLAALMGTQTATLAREAALHESAILSAVRDILQTAFATEGRRQYLDPFAPAAERNTEVITVLRQAIAEHRVRSGVLARVPADDETLLALFAATLGWGPAQRYLDDPRVNEVKIVGKRIRVQEAGKPFVTAPEAFDTTDEVQSRAILLASVLGVRLDSEIPQATLPVAHGTRMHVSIPPRTVEGALVCVRRGRREAWDMDDVLRRGTLDTPVADLLKLFSRARCSMLIAGRTGSGKTGLLESLANAWPGDPHTLTIEDHTMEIGIRRADIWTRELVDTQRDPLAFGRVAREALRQTPDLLLPGEIRGNEAGAILALVLSDHPVISTLHARSCQEAIERFASCAALPGAYMYEARRDDALRDACSGFDVLIKVDFWEDTGRRLITEVALLAGSTIEHGVVKPTTIPLVKVDVQPDSEIVWACSARVVQGGMLEWDDGKDHTPEALREKLKRARALAQIRAAATTLDAVAEAIGRAERLLLAGESERALATLKSAWVQRHDPRLISVAQRALAQARGTFATLIDDALAQFAVLEGWMVAKRWQAARSTYEQLLMDLDIAAAAVPMGGWEQIDARIRAGLAQEAEAEEARLEAATALAQGHPNVAVEMLKRFPMSELPRHVALQIALVREQALTALLARGEGSSEALASVRAQRLALESPSADVGLQHP
jgi:Flp pilus assembly CpaF family ATPase